MQKNMVKFKKKRGNAMKYMIVSDIHGDADCTEKFLEYFRGEGCDMLIILGDILYHGPRNDLPDGYAPKNVIELLNENKDKLLCVRGNCDTEVDQMVLDFTVNPDPMSVEIIGIKTLLTHGHKTDVEGDFGGEFSLILYGHTHLLRAEKNRAGITVVNPGSTSIPKGGNPNTLDRKSTRLNSSHAT